MRKNVDLMRVLCIQISHPTKGFCYSLIFAFSTLREFFYSLVAYKLL